MEKESEPERERPSWRKLGQQWDRKYIRLRQHAEPGSCQRTWLLYPPLRLCLIQSAPSKIPRTTYPRAPQWEGPFRQPPWAPLPSLLNSAHLCLENKALWNERPSLSALWGLGHHLHDNPPTKACELMTDGWDERSGIGGWLLLLGEEKRIREARRRDSWVTGSHCSFPAKYQFTL